MRQLKNQKEANALKLELLEKQGFVCPITGYRLTMGNAALDHRHETGQVRGPIFGGANRMLRESQWVRFGIRCEDIPSVLRKMADYLERPQLDILHHTCRKKEPVLQKASFLQLEKEIRKSGKPPAWFRYSTRNGKAAQKMNAKLQALFDKYGIVPRFYA
jgi:hypothetical protein